MAATVANARRGPVLDAHYGRVVLDHVFTDAIGALREAFEAAFLERQPFEEHFQSDVLLGDGQRADRRDRLSIKHRLPHATGVARLPHAAAN